MPNAQIEKLGEILAYLLRLMGGECFSKTKLVKLLYILDVVKSRSGSPHYTGATYKSYYYGPYSSDIEDAISFLTEIGALDVNQKEGINGNSYYHFRLVNVPYLGHLDEGAKSDIQRLIGPLVNLDLQKLLDLAYTTREFKEAEFGKEIHL